jgi:hypothetical protein
MSADKLSEIEGVSRVRFLVTFFRTAKSNVKPIENKKELSELKRLTQSLMKHLILSPQIITSLL